MVRPVSAVTARMRRDETIATISHAAGGRAAKGRRPRVVAFGECMLRLSTHARIEFADSVDVHIGGSESNVSVALAQLGWDARWFSALPDTPLGRRVANDLHAHGVDVSGVRCVDGARVGLFFVEIAQPPRSTTVWYDRADSAAAKLKPADLDPSVLDGADYAVVGGVTAAIGAGPRAVALRFATETTVRGAKVCVDVNYRPRPWSEDEAASAIVELLGVGDIVVCSSRDAERLWALDGDSTEVVTHLHEAHAPNAELVVLTIGSDGAVASCADGLVLEQPAYPTTVVERIGAGDAFVGGLLWGLEARDVSEALRAGELAAAPKCTLRGDYLLITASEFEQRFDDNERREAVVR